MRKYFLKRAQVDYYGENGEQFVQAGKGCFALIN